jgi:hypothetical protein
VSHVLGVTAFQVGNPMALLILMETDDPLRDRRHRLLIGVQSALDRENSDRPFLAVTESMVDKNELTWNVRQHFENHSPAWSHPKGLNSS